MIASLPARGVWIEIVEHPWDERSETSRSPQGECGLKYAVSIHTDPLAWSRSPQGECGLKYFGARPFERVRASLPARGVWIEILLMGSPFLGGMVAPRKGSVD